MEQQTAHKTVLLAKEGDDVEIFIKLLRSFGYEVIHVRDGAAALNVVKKKHPHVAVVDADLPQVDGIAVCKKLKGDFLTAYIPVILLIGKKSVRKKILEIERGLDDYLVKPPDPIDLQVRIEIALRRSEHKFFNPLTKLPGSIAIEQEIEARIRDRKTFSVAYCDINSFKPFNDRYGYAKGNLVIQQTAAILAQALRKFGAKEDFVGHIGGDDFLLITTPDKENLLSYDIISEFDRLIRLHYSPNDRQRGYIAVADRTGSERRFPLVSISIAIVNNKARKFDNYLEIGQIASEIKTYLKSLQCSAYMANRRAAQEGAPEKRKGKDAPVPVVTKVKADDTGGTPPLGQMLLAAHLITEDHLTTALRRHLITGQKVGEVLIDMGFVSANDVGCALAKQHDIPIVTVSRDELEEQLETFPKEIIREFRMVPIKREGKKLFVGMVNPFDEALVARLKEKLACPLEVSYLTETNYSQVVSYLFVNE